MSDRKMVGTVGFAMVENPYMQIFRAIGPTSKEKIDRVLIQHTVAGRVRQTKSGAMSLVPNRLDSPKALVLKQ